MIEFKPQSRVLLAAWVLLLAGCNSIYLGDLLGPPVPLGPSAGVDDPNSSVDDGGRDPNAPFVVARMSSFLPFPYDLDNHQFASRGASVRDSDVWIEGEFPRFTIHWSPELEVRSVEVEYLVRSGDEDPYGIRVDGREFDPNVPSILPPVVYGAYNIPGTQPMSRVQQPAPTMTLGVDDLGFGRFLSETPNGPRDDQTIEIRIYAFDPENVRPNGDNVTSVAAIFYVANNLSRGGREDDIAQCASDERECLGD